MEVIVPEILFHIFDLVVHTSHDPNPSFPPRIPVRSRTKGDDSQGCWVVKEPRYPDFPSGITSHETNPHTPLSLSHVCKQWRSAVFAESNLWSTIYVTNGKEGFHDLLKLWLERSGSRPLKIVFRDSSDCLPTEGKAVVAMLSLAAAHSRRWRSFKVRLRRICLPSQGVWEALKHVDALNLQELAFSFNGVSVGHTYQNFIDMFMERWAGLMRLPSLRGIQIWSTMDHDVAFLSSIPFPHLATITLPMVSIRSGSRFVSNLSRCTSLRTLSISLSLCEKQFPESYTLSIPSLHNLDVIGFSPPHINAFLRVFQLPALKHLSIHSNSLSLVVPEGLALLDALDHWKPRLCSLELRGEQSSPIGPAFTSLLYHPSLETLHYLRVGGIRATNIFHLLTMSLGHSPMPHLQHIYIETLYPCDCEAPVKMALSRSKLKGPPLTVEVEFLEEEDLVWAAEFWDQHPDAGLKKVDKRFKWVGTGERRLEREFMIRDFSMIQGWS